MLSAENLVCALLEDFKSQLPRLKREFPGLPDNILAEVEKVDPSGSYSRWVIRQCLKRSIVLPEDTEKVADLLDKFSRLKQSPRFKGDKNLDAYPTLQALYRALEEYSEQRSADFSSQHKGIDLLKRSGHLELYQASAWPDIMDVSQGTNWCTRYAKNAKDYGAGGPLYVVVKDGKQYAAVHAKFPTAVDVADEDISESMANEIAPLFDVGILKLDKMPNKDHERKRYQHFVDDITSQMAYKAQEECITRHVRLMLRKPEHGDLLRRYAAGTMSRSDSDEYCRLRRKVKKYLDAGRITYAAGATPADYARYALTAAGRLGYKSEGYVHLACAVAASHGWGSSVSP